MQTITKALAKGTLATVAAGAMAVATASPAAAQDRYRDHDDGISAGEVIAGAVILGGLAAVIAGSDNDRYDRYDRYDRRGYRGDYRGDYRRNYRNRGYRDNARIAVERCVRAAELHAQRYTGANAEVYEIRDIDRERYGFEVKGRIAVRNDYRGRGYRRGYRNSGWDEGRFTCDYRGGRVTDIDYSGIRGL